MGIGAWLVLTSIITATDPSNLLLSHAVQKTFLDRWSPSFVRVHYDLPLLPAQDERFRQRRMTLGTVIAGPEGTRLWAPTQRLQGITEVSVEWADGTRAKATVQPPEDPNNSPLVLLKLKDTKSLPKFAPLVWSAEESPSPGVFLWAIEWPIAHQLPNVDARPVLIRTSLGPSIEPPLQRFFYVNLSRADGLALLTSAGEVACILFRPVPGHAKRSLCAPKSTLLNSTKGSPLKAAP